MGRNPNTDGDEKHHLHRFRDESRRKSNPESRFDVMRQKRALHSPPRFKLFPKYFLEESKRTTSEHSPGNERENNGRDLDRRERGKEKLGYETSDERYG